MPIYMDISRIEQRLVVIVARGHVTAEELAENTKTLIAANVPGFAKIIDVAGSASDLAREQVQRIADMLRSDPDSPLRRPVAFVGRAPGGGVGAGSKAASERARKGAL